MKLIQQSFEILEQTDFSLIGIKKFIERCGRVCYKSENRITDTSYDKFVNMLVKRDHARPLEFGTVHLKMILQDFKEFIHSLLIIGMFNNIWIKYAYKGDIVYITTNYRYYLYIIKNLLNVKKYFTEEDNEYYPKRYTVHMILDRGVMDEFRTHVGLSHLAESTRYCSYNKDKFGNEITFIKPCWDIRESNYIDYLQKAEDGYFRMLKNGWVPQQAREILPLSVKSELISCGFKDAWSNFFYRRCAKDAHPMAREIATKVRDKFNEFKNETKESK